MIPKLTGSTATGLPRSSAVERAVRAHFGLRRWGDAGGLVATRARVPWAVGRATRGRKVHLAKRACVVWEQGVPIAVAVLWRCGAYSWAPVGAGLESVTCLECLHRLPVPRPLGDLLPALPQGSVA